MPRRCLRPGRDSTSAISCAPGLAGVRPRRTPLLAAQACGAAAARRIRAQCGAAAAVLLAAAVLRAGNGAGGGAVRDHDQGRACTRSCARRRSSSGADGGVLIPAWCSRALPYACAGHAFDCWARPAALAAAHLRELVAYLVVASAGTLLFAVGCSAPRPPPGWSTWSAAPAPRLPGSCSPTASPRRSLGDALQPAPLGACGPRSGGSAAHWRRPISPPPHRASSPRRCC